jgi:amino acid transporter
MSSSEPTDVEKNQTVVDDAQPVTKDEAVTSVEYTKQGRFRNFLDSFKKKDMSEYEGLGLTDAEIAARATADAPLNRSLKNRHLQMIAIGGSIGTGLFVGSGNSFRTGGPAAVLIGFSLVGTMLFNTVHSLGELAVRYPVSGSFSTYSTRFIDPAWGFAMGWNYALQWLVVFPLELVAASLTIGFWSSDGTAAATVNPDAWVALFYVMIALINLFGVKGYGEAEFVFSIIKVIAVVGFIILGIVINCGGGPNEGYIGGRYWHDPGAFSHGFKGVISVFVNAAFAFAGTELVGLASAETENPRRHLPRATKQVFWRICLFYVVALSVVGLLVPYDDPNLIGSSSSDASASPFVIAVQRAGIKGLPSVINVVILIAVLSVGNSAVFGCSRTLAALGAQRQAPKIFAYIDRRGRPIIGIAVTLTFGLLCFLAGSDKQGDVFDWLLAFSGLSSVVTWGSVCLCHVRYRRGMKVQGISTDVLAFKSALGVPGAMYGAGLNFLIICLQFWVALAPVGTDKPDVENFFKNYLTVPVVLAFFIPWKIWHKTSFVRAKDMDLTTGVRELDIDKLIRENLEERERVKSKGILYRIYHFWC